MVGEATAERIAENSMFKVIARVSMTLSLPILGFFALTAWNLLASHTDAIAKVNERVSVVEQRISDGQKARDAQYSALSSQVGTISDTTNAKFDVIIDKMTSLSNDVAAANAVLHESPH